MAVSELALAAEQAAALPTTALDGAARAAGHVAAHAAEEVATRAAEQVAAHSAEHGPVLLAVGFSETEAAAAVEVAAAGASGAPYLAERTLFDYGLRGRRWSDLVDDDGGSDEDDAAAVASTEVPDGIASPFAAAGVKDELGKVFEWDVFELAVDLMHSMGWPALRPMGPPLGLRLAGSRAAVQRRIRNGMLALPPGRLTRIMASVSKRLRLRSRSGAA